MRYIKLAKLKTICQLGYSDSSNPTQRPSVLSYPILDFRLPILDWRKTR